VNSLHPALDRCQPCFEAFKAGIESDPRLKVSVQTTPAVLQAASQKSIAQIVGLVRDHQSARSWRSEAFFRCPQHDLRSGGRPVAGDQRTLRAIGFHGGPVIVSVLFETLLLAALGGRRRCRN